MTYRLQTDHNMGARTSTYLAQQPQTQFDQNDSNQLQHWHLKFQQPFKRMPVVGRKANIEVSAEWRKPLE